ncbi:MAG: HD domain-containing protein [Chitinophagaceae bacterium]
MDSVRKIINDPVYGFITVDNPLIFRLISHPWYQRLRRIHQMAFACLVFPGAEHSRLHHSLGAYHLMHNALVELKNKGVEITPEEDEGAKAAILLHDIGHGPYSHAMEHILTGVDHETISLLIMRQLNIEFEGALEMAINIFTDNYEKPFLHQLVSGQLDVDRMDYLTRDSFFTGVSEGAIGYDRILKMLTVRNGDLMVEEKGIFTTEKFLVSRRLMYWQVYLHKTVLSAEKMLVRIIQRAKELIATGTQLKAATEAFDFFLQRKELSDGMANHLATFCLIDDYDVLTTIKNWVFNPDPILSMLCKGLVNRQLFKVKLQALPFEPAAIEDLRNRICKRLHVSHADSKYFLLEGEAQNTTYDPSDERITILFKDGNTRDISDVDNALIHHNLASPVKKFYVCYIDML